MNESGNPRSEKYSRLREDFDALRIEDKAIFLLESTMTTLVRGIEAFGTALGRELEGLFRRADEAVAEAEAAAEAAEAGTPAPNVTPEPPPAATGPTPPDTDIPGPRTSKRGPAIKDDDQTAP